MMNRALRAAALVLVWAAPLALPAGADAQEREWPRAPHAPGPGWLGLAYEVRWVQHDRTCEPNVVVASVVGGAPAERAGLRPGDAIVALNGQRVSGGRLPFAAASLAPGDSVRLRVSRPGGVREILAVADLRPSRPPVTLTRPADGLSASDAPVVTLRGDSIIARNLEPHQLLAGRGYWLAHGDGRAEYRRLDRFGGGEVDRRVAELLRCAGEAGIAAPMPPPPPAPAEQLHRRADSLRYVIARRAMTREVPNVVLEQDRMMTAVTAPRVQMYAYRTGDEIGTEVRSVAGAALTRLEPGLAEYFRGARDGLLVIRVAPGTPAARAGLRAGDVITEGGGRRLDSVDGLLRLLSRPDPASVELRVVRHGRSRMITLRDD